MPPLLAPLFHVPTVRRTSAAGGCSGQTMNGLAAAAVIQTAPSVETLGPPSVVVDVKFRIFTERHLLPPSAFLATWHGVAPVVGELVVVQGDRGEDIGSVEAVHVPVDHDANHFHGDSKLPKVLRKANPADVLQFYEARRREDLALQVAHDCLKRVPSLGDKMEIVAVEYQADFQKLSVVYRVPWNSANDSFASRRSTSLTTKPPRRRVDFRELQRELFRRFKCRIWLVDELDVASTSER